MKKSVLTLSFLLAILSLGLASAQASELDLYLQPHCGVGEPPIKTEEVLARFGDEIYARAIGFQMMESNASNNILIWYLGGLTDTRSRELAEQVVRYGAEPFRQMVMGAVSHTPNWSGLRLVAIGASDASEETRDSASSILADVEYSLLATKGAQLAEHRATILAALDAQIPLETNARLRGNLETARQKIATVQIASSN